MTAGDVGGGAQDFLLNFLRSGSQSSASYWDYRAFDRLLTIYQNFWAIGQQTTKDIPVKIEQDKKSVPNEGLRLFPAIDVLTTAVSFDLPSPGSAGALFIFCQLSDDAERAMKQLNVKMEQLN